MKLDGTDFNVSFWATWSEPDFIMQCLSDGVYKNCTEPDRRALLLIAYKLIQDEYLGAGKKAEQV